MNGIQVGNSNTGNPGSTNENNLDYSPGRKSSNPLPNINEIVK